MTCQLGFSSYAMSTLLLLLVDHPHSRRFATISSNSSFIAPPVRNQIFLDSNADLFRCPLKVSVMFMSRIFTNFDPDGGILLRESILLEYMFLPFSIYY